jgi:hypothetical protein
VSADRCPLTGEKLVQATAGPRRPFAVKVENSPASRPQSGLSRADMVFEHLAEGGITRFTAIFLCQEAQAIGPVRSARLIDLELVPMFDAIFAHVGASAPIMDKIAQSEVAKSDLDEYRNAPGFHRITERKAPYNAYTSTGELRDAAKQRDLLKEVKLTGLAFADTPPTGGTPAKRLLIPYRKGLSDAEYQYEAASGKYRRFVAGEPLVDAVSGETIVAANVIVLYASHTETDIIEDTLGSRSVQIDLKGKGRAVIFRDGQQYEAVWVRTESGQMIRYLDLQGAAFSLKPGNIWVEVVPPELAIEAQ